MTSLTAHASSLTNLTAPPSLRVAASADTARWANPSWTEARTVSHNMGRQQRRLTVLTDDGTRLACTDYGDPAARTHGCVPARPVPELHQLDTAHHPAHPPLRARSADHHLRPPRPRPLRRRPRAQLHHQPPGRRPVRRAARPARPRPAHAGRPFDGRHDRPGLPRPAHRPATSRAHRAGPDRHGRRQTHPTRSGPTAGRPRRRNPASPGRTGSREAAEAPSSSRSAHCCPISATTSRPPPWPRSP